MEILSMSSLRIIHTSDWHCGASRNIPEYLNRWRDAFDDMRQGYIDELESTGYDQAQELYDALMEKLAE